MTPSRAGRPPALRTLSVLALAAASEDRPSWLERLGLRRKQKSQAELDAERRKRRNIEHHEEDKPQPFVQCPECSASLRANHMEDHMKRVH